jgi:hypothetical protein
MSLVVTKKLVCDWPECGTVKSDLVWWEDSIGEGIWNRTKDGRDWCPKHTRDEITALLTDEESTDG